MCCPGTDNGYRVERDVHEERVRQSDADVVVCPSVSFNLECRGWQLLSSLLAHAEARRVNGGVCPLVTQVTPTLRDQSSPTGQPSAVSSGFL